MTAATLTGLFFVACEDGPVGGVVLGASNRETLIVQEKSESELRTVYVPIAVAVGWSFYEREAEAIEAFGRLGREVLWEQAIPSTICGLTR